MAGHEIFLFYVPGDIPILIFIGVALLYFTCLLSKLRNSTNNQILLSSRNARWLLP